MKRLVVASVLLLGGVSGAFAGTPVDHYRDLIRPHGYARSGAVFQAGLDHCYNQTRADRTKHDTPAFRKCMATRGYRWRYASSAPTPRRQLAGSGAAGWPPFHVGISFGGGGGDAGAASPTPNPSTDEANAANAAAQDMNNAAQAAATQTEVQFNTIYSLGN